MSSPPSFPDFRPGVIRPITEAESSETSPPSVYIGNLPMIETSPPSSPGLSLPSAGITLPPISSGGFDLPSVPSSRLPLPSGEFNLPPVPSSGLPLPSEGLSLPIPSSGITLPSLPSISLPSAPLSGMGLPKIGTVPGSVFYFLGDNETGKLNWLRSDRPQPDDPNSSYQRVGCIGDGSCFFHAVSKGISKLYESSYQDFEEIDENTLKRFEEFGNIQFQDNIFDQPRTSDGFYRILNKSRFDGLMINFRTNYAQNLRAKLAEELENDPDLRQIVLDRYGGSIELKSQELLDALPQEIQRALDRGEMDKVERLIQLNDNPAELQRQAFENLIREYQAELLSGNSVQPDFMVLLSDYLNVDIYLIRDADLSSTNPTLPLLYGGSSLHVAVHGPSSLREPNDPYFNEPDRNSIIIISVNDAHFELIGKVTFNPEKEIQTLFSEEEPIIQHLYTILQNLR